MCKESRDKVESLSWVESQEKLLLLLPHGDSSPLLFVPLFSFLFFSFHIFFVNDPYFPSFAFPPPFFFCFILLSAPVGASERASVGLSSILNHFLFSWLRQLGSLKDAVFPFPPFFSSVRVIAACCPTHNGNGVGHRLDNSIISPSLNEIRDKMMTKGQWQSKRRDL